MKGVDGLSCEYDDRNIDKEFGWCFIDSNCDDNCHEIHDKTNSHVNGYCYNFSCYCCRELFWNESKTRYNVINNNIYFQII